MDAFVFKGHICDSIDRNHLRILEHHYLVCEDGRCKGVFPTLPAAYAAVPVEDFGDRLIIPGLIDLHLHAPQFSFRGLGMDMELLDWLNTHTFPEESKYRDLAYADLAYSQLTAHLIRSETTRACLFATVHVPATELLMEKLEQSGLITYVGKVNMNRNGPMYLIEPSTVEAVRQTRKWLSDTVGRFSRTKPIITPRFIPSCTDDLLYRLADLRAEFGVPVQSHLSENLGEIAWVKELVPTAKNYGDAYRKFGLLGGDYPCIMAHCVHSDALEMEYLKENGVFVAHSPESNMNIASGVAPVNRFLDYGIKVGLATDVAGGSHESMFKAMTHAIQASKLRWRLLDQSVAPLTFDTAFYLATRGGGAFFGKVGAFEEGFEMDALVLDDSNLDHPQPLSVRERLERFIYLGDERNLYAKVVGGRRLF